MLDSNGDVVIEKRKIQMIEGNDLLKQKVQLVLGTNKGEWVLNKDEGINFQNIFNPKLNENISSEKSASEVYLSEINSIKSDNAELSKLLEDRLEGNI